MNEPPPASPDETSEYELEPEIRWTHRFIWWLRSWKGITAGVLLLVGLVLFWNGEAIYRSAKIWRAERLIAKADEAARVKDFAGQLKLLRQAFVIAPATPVTVRAAARFHEARGEPAALPLYESLLQMPEATIDDKIRACRLGFSFGRIDFSTKLLAELRRDDGAKNSPALLALEGQYAASKGQWTEALDLGRKAVAAVGSTPAEKLILASMLVRASSSSAEQSAKWRNEAVDLLASLSQAADDFGAQAVSSLISLTRDPGAAGLLAGRDVSPWVEAAGKHAGLPPRMRVAAWDLFLISRKNAADETFAAFLQRWRESPLEERLEAARWLNQHGKPAMSLQVSEPQRDTSSDWFLVFLDSLAATGRWDAVLDSLERKEGSAESMPAALRSVFALRARTELGRKVNKDEAWRDIQILVQRETVQNQLYIAQYAEKTGEPRQAMTIFRRLLEGIGTAAKFQQELSREEKIACYTGVIRLTPENAPATELLPLFEGLLQEVPDLAEAMNDAIYLRLLTDGPNPSMRDRLQSLLSKNPAVLAYRSTAALYELRSGNAKAADQLYDGWQIDWKTAADRFKAVRVAVLEAAAKSDEARALRDSMDAKRLRPEENKLLQGER